MLFLCSMQLTLTTVDSNIDCTVNYVLKLERKWKTKIPRIKLKVNKTTIGTLNSFNNYLIFITSFFLVRGSTKCPRFHKTPVESSQSSISQKPTKERSHKPKFGFDDNTAVEHV